MRAKIIFGLAAGKKIYFYFHSKWWLRSWSSGSASGLTLSLFFNWKRKTEYG